MNAWRFEMRREMEQLQQLDIERIEAETDTLRRRVDAIEKRIAG